MRITSFRPLRFGLPLLLLIALVTAIACHGVARRSGTGASQPAPVAIEQLWRAPTAYEGHLVTASGTLLVFEQGTPSQYFVLESPAQFRVGIKGADQARLPNLVGSAIEISGPFRFSPAFGGYIDARTVARVSS